MALAKINGIKCYYEVHGQGKELLLIAGLASDSQSWLPVLPALKKHFKVIIFDNRGSGRTRSPAGGFNVRTMAKDAAALLGFLGVEKADVLGHSMGGCIAQELAIRYPAKVERLILASTAARMADRNKLLFNNMAKMLEGGVPLELFWRDFAFWLYRPEFFDDKIAVDQAIKYIIKYPYLQSSDDFKSQLDALNSYDLSDRAGKIRAKTLVVIGKDDNLILPKESKALADKIRGAGIVYLKDCAHCIVAERPKEFVKCVKNFLVG